MAEELRVICDFYQPLADEKNIRLDCNGNGFIFANSIMMRRMLGNLLSNSLKYTAENGLVKLEVSEDDHYVNISVHDDGIGIAAEHVPFVFNRFYRTDTARSHQSGGTGLGLAIAKSIVDLHGGKIGLQSVPQLGTKVNVMMPKGI